MLIAQEQATARYGFNFHDLEWTQQLEMEKVQPPKVGLMREQRALVAGEEPPKVGLMREQRVHAGEDSEATKGGSQCSWGAGRR